MIAMPENTPFQELLSEAHSHFLQQRVVAAIVCYKEMIQIDPVHGIKLFCQFFIKVPVSDYLQILNELVLRNSFWQKFHLIIEKNRDIAGPIIAFLVGGVDAVYYCINQKEFSLDKIAFDNLIQNNFENILLEVGDEDLIKKWQESDKKILLKNRAYANKVIASELPAKVIIKKIPLTIDYENKTVAKKAVEVTLHALSYDSNNNAAMSVLESLLRNKLDCLDLNIIEKIFPKTSYSKIFKKIQNEFPLINSFYFYSLLIYLTIDDIHGLLKAINDIAIYIFANDKHHEFSDLLEFFAKLLMELKEDKKYQKSQRDFFEQEGDLFQFSLKTLSQLEFKGSSEDTLHIYKIVMLAKLGLIDVYVQDKEKLKNTLLHKLVANEICIASSPNNISLVGELLRADLLRGFINLQDAYGQTLAILASRIPNPQSTLLFLYLNEAGADFSIQDNFGNTVLHYSALLGLKTQFETILNSLPIEKKLKILKLKNNDGQTPIDIIDENFALTGSLDILGDKINKILLSREVTGERSLNAYGNFFRVRRFNIVFVNKNFTNEIHVNALIDECCQSRVEDMPLIQNVQGRSVIQLIELHKEFLKSHRGESVLRDKYANPLSWEETINLENNLTSLSFKTLTEECLEGVKCLYTNEIVTINREINRLMQFSTEGNQFIDVCNKMELYILKLLAESSDKVSYIIKHLININNARNLHDKLSVIDAAINDSNLSKHRNFENLPQFFQKIRMAPDTINLFKMLKEALEKSHSLKLSTCSGMASSI